MQRQHPHLKSGADLQLQTAFQEGNWAVVVRLAEKRARTLGDAYYEVGNALSVYACAAGESLLGLFTEPNLMI